MSPDEADQLHKLSKDVFGQTHFLGVAVAFRRAATPLSASDLVSLLGVRHPTSLQPSLRRLIAGRFVNAVEAPSSDRATRYEATDSAFWALVDELYEQATTQGTLFE